ncbi:MAG: phospho-sugar mutase [Bacilli bacterium]|nr:phospho-sugar mutase [Bacilli bacterium]
MKELENYNLWLSKSDLDKDLREAMQKMSEDEIYDAFYCNLEFGTAGIRGVLGPGTNRMNKYVVRKASYAFGQYVLKYVNNAKSRGVVIAHDNRHMSREFCIETARVLLTLGVKAYIFDSLRPTPELSFAVRDLNCAGGVVITASHNPRQYNGFKVYDEHGCQLVPHLIDKLLEFYNGVHNVFDVKVDLTVDDSIITLDHSLDLRYYEAVDKIRLNRNLKTKDFTVVYTPEHGTGLKGVEYLLLNQGYNLHLVKEQCSPDPDFSNTKSPNPEEKGAFEKAIELAKKVKADLIIATDPDADRLGVVELHNDEPVYFTGNQTGAMLIEYIINSHKQNGTFKDNYVVFNTIVTSSLGAKIALASGVDVKSTLTGFKFIGEQIDILKKEDKQRFLFGYEESYGYLISSICRDKDALQASTLICEMACYYKEQGLTLKDVLHNIYEKYGYFYDKVKSISFSGEQGLQKIKDILQYFRKSKLKRLGDMNVMYLEDYLYSVKEGNHEKYLLTLPKSNVLRYIFSDGSFVAIRPSGTEPKCKFYFNVIGNNKEDALQKGLSLEKFIDDLVKTI